MARLMLLLLRGQVCVVLWRRDERVGVRIRLALQTPYDERNFVGCEPAAPSRRRRAKRSEAKQSKAKQSKAKRSKAKQARKKNTPNEDTAMHECGCVIVIKFHVRITFRTSPWGGVFILRHGLLPTCAAQRPIKRPQRQRRR